MKYTYKSKKDYSNVYKVLVVLAVAAIGVLIFQLVSSRTRVLNIALIPDLSTSGYLKMNVDAGVSEGSGVVVLTGGCYQLTASTETGQAESIANGLAKKIEFRPGTHDLMRDALDNLGIEVVMIKIVDLKNSTFYGKLILKQGNKVVSLDSRPSDGIAIAVRTGSPVYIREDLMKSQGKYIC